MHFASGEQRPAEVLNRIASIFIFMMCYAFGYGQEISSESLKLTIKEGALTIDSSSNTLKVTLTFQNESDHDMAVYGLSGDLQAAPMALSELCRPDVGTGIAMAFYHEDGTQEMPTVHMAGYAKAKAYKTPDSVRKAGEKEFVRSRMVIGKGSALSFVKELPHSDFYLEKGSYTLEIIYYCGQSISNVLNVKKVNKGKAVLFQGCALAKRIPVLIR